jgi:hypothetical protein
MFFLFLLPEVPVYSVLFFSSAVIVFNILDSILKFSGKSIVPHYIWLKWIRIRIRQHNADPTGSGSTTTLLFGLFDTHLGFLHLRLDPVPELEISLLFISALLSHAPLLLAQKLYCGERTFVG